MTGVLRGQALKRVGDFMPPMPSGQMEPFETRIFVFSPPIPYTECRSPWTAYTQGEIDYSYGENGWPWGNLYLGSQEPVAVVTTDESGNFSIELESGAYSVFVEYMGRPYVWFSSRYAGGVEIRAGETLERDMIINLGTD